MHSIVNTGPNFFSSCFSNGQKDGNVFLGKRKKIKDLILIEWILINYKFVFVSN